MKGKGSASFLKQLTNTQMSKRAEPMDHDSKIDDICNIK
jgi:hypothetical protein